MRTLAVVHGKDASATANVLLDSGSSCSYVSERLAKRLYLTGKNKNVAVGVLGGNVMEDTLRVVHMQMVTS